MFLFRVVVECFADKYDNFACDLLYAFVWCVCLCMCVLVRACNQMCLRVLVVV